MDTNTIGLVSLSQKDIRGQTFADTTKRSPEAQEASEKMDPADTLI
jgi:hypothetical protein